MDPNWIVNHGGLYLVVFIVFAETGLFFGFFFPGDSLLFVTGIIIASAQVNPYPFEAHLFNLFFWIVLVVIAAVLGNFVGYWFGKKSGPLLYKKEDTLVFKKKHLIAATEFYEKKGGIAIFLARFLPFIRTFAPIVGGVVRMDFKKFVFYNFAGALCWVVIMTSLGYILGENEWVKNNLEYIVIFLVIITTAPVLYKAFFSRKHSTSQGEEGKVDDRNKVEIK